MGAQTSSGESNMAKKKKRIPKTIAMRVLEEKGIAYQVHQHAHKQYTAEGVAEDLGIPVAQVVKAMIVQRSDRQFVLVVVPGDRRLSLKKVGAVLNDKNVKLASERDVQRVTGFQVGAVSVLGFRRTDVPAYVDQHVMDLEQAVISAGTPVAGLALSPDALMQALEGAVVGDFCEDVRFDSNFEQGAN
jgi:Cys-tRNA(Pro)/Cys-tRNA(Cys) deacylase